MMTSVPESRARTRVGRGTLGLAAGVVLGVLGATVGVQGAAHVVDRVAGARGDAVTAADPGGAGPAAAAETVAAQAPDDGDSVLGSTGRGLVHSRDGYPRTDVTGPRTPGVPGRLRFTITGPDGLPVRNFAPVMTRPMQVYVVRADLGDFVHLRPIAEKDGSWTANVTWSGAGPYRVLTEFSAVDARDGIHHLVLGRTLTVPGRYRRAALPHPTASAVVDGYRITLSGQVADAYSSGSMRLHITRQGEDVASLQPYLGSYVFVTCFREGDNALMRTVPVEAPESARSLGGPKLTLKPVFPAPGRYRMFLEFRTFDQIRTASLTLHAP